MEELRYIRYDNPDNPSECKIECSNGKLYSAELLTGKAKNWRYIGRKEPWLEIDES